MSGFMISVRISATPLPQSARQCLGEGVLQPGQSEPREIFAGFSLSRDAIDATRREPKERIAEDGAPWKQQVFGVMWPMRSRRLAAPADLMKSRSSKLNLRWSRTSISPA